VGPMPSFPFGSIPLRFAKLNGIPLRGLLIQQPRLEQLLGERAGELGVEVRRGHELVSLSQDGEGVTADVQGPNGRYRLRAPYLVGCDGARSTVREQAGIEFPGTTDEELARLGHVVLEASAVVPASAEVELPGPEHAQQTLLAGRDTRVAPEIGVPILADDKPSSLWIRRSNNLAVCLGARSAFAGCAPAS
jgi:2-polyprenyl-6-methoxyphenol hydroxylase-like FAD-dependent oxidoreductase